MGQVRFENSKAWYNGRTATQGQGAKTVRCFSVGSQVSQRRRGNDTRRFNRETTSIVRWLGITAPWILSSLLNY